MNRSPLPGTRKGFTLIELLVVIAIIAILAAILFPVFQKVREKARQTTCASNLKQIGLSIIQYEQDFDEKYPGEVTGNGTPGAIIGWRTVLTPYTKSIPVFTCPSNPNNAQTPDWDSVNGYKRSYAVNPIIMPDVYDDPTSALFSGRVAQPTETFMVGESILNYASLSEGCALFDNTGALQSQCKPDHGNGVVQGLFAGHTTLSNWLFCDGHVKALRPTATCNATRDIWMVDSTFAPALPCDTTLQSDMGAIEQKYQ